MRALLLALTLGWFPWVTWSSPSGNQIGSFVSNGGATQTLLFEGYAPVILLCYASAEYYKRTGTLSCEPAIPFPIPEGLR